MRTLTLKNKIFVYLQKNLAVELLLKHIYANRF